MKTKNKKSKFKKLELAPEQQRALQEALKPALLKLNYQPHLTTFNIVASQDGQLCLTFQQRKTAFNEEDVGSALFWKKFPPGMTAKDLAVIPMNSSRRKNETALHLVISKGLYPRGLTKVDLLETRGRNKRRAIFALFDEYAIKPKFPADLSAVDLAKIKTSSSSLLHKAAYRGVFPKNITVQELKRGRDKYGMTPLHTAANFGNLIPCTMAELKGSRDNLGRTAWDIAVKEFAQTYSPETAINNLLACPELARMLNPNRKSHREKLELLVKDRRLTPELRDKIAIYPRVCAAML